MSDDRLADVLSGMWWVPPDLAPVGATAIRAALASGDLSPEDLGMVEVEVYVGKPDHTETLYDLPSAPEPGSSDTSREAPAPSLRCAPSPGTADGPRPVAEAP